MPSFIGNFLGESEQNDEGNLIPVVGDRRPYEVFAMSGIAPMGDNPYDSDDDPLEPESDKEAKAFITNFIRENRGYGAGQGDLPGAVVKFTLPKGAMISVYAPHQMGGGGGLAQK